MSYKSSQMVPRQSLTVQTPFQVSPAKARKLENVMRGSGNSISQHGITQIGFGHDACTVDVNDLYPMEISKSIPEEKDIDQLINQKVNKMSMRNRRRSSSQHLHDTSSKDSLSGRKRRQNEVPLTSFGINHPNKRHCAQQNNNHNILLLNENSNNSSMMLIDDPNSRYMTDMDPNNGLNNELLTLRNDNNRMNELLQLTQKKNDNLNTEMTELRNELQQSEMKLNEQIARTSAYETEKLRNDRACCKLKLLLNEIARSERQERETKLIEDNKMLGRVVQCHSNNSFTHALSDIWEDGQLFDDLKRRRKILEREKEEIERRKKELRKLKTKNKNKDKENKDKENTKDGFVIPQNKNKNKNKNSKPLNKLALDSDIVSIRLALIKKQLQELDQEYATLEYRKKIHIKFIRLMRDARKSRFSINKKHECYVLNDRYVLINLLGRGGFSEVHRGYDLVEHKYIAAKIHQLNSQWSDERKRNYTKHATREYDIHKSLNHENIVSLYDVFGIDVNSFCTVLEYSDGMDLDMYLKINKLISEREARSLIIQMFRGLKYLHNSLPIIIHYDLKPGNLLYRHGLIRLTDFGLAKIIQSEDGCEDRDSNGEIELTSQGAGTYWYLPPECFKSYSHNKPIMISPKVDIWSGGVIFYQMLFAKRPFGDNLSQDTILNNKTILNAHNVIFPNQPKSVSKQAKDFIKQCCAYDPKLRLSSNQIVDQHPYFAFLRK